YFELCASSRVRLYCFWFFLAACEISDRRSQISKAPSTKYQARSTKHKAQNTKYKAPNTENQDKTQKHKDPILAMPITITNIIVPDVRFPTSGQLDGSDAMNADPNYSAAYVVLETDSPERLEGHGLTFTIGRGNELCVAAMKALRPLVVGLTIGPGADMGAVWKRLTSDSQLRWVGPEKGVIHLATAALVNALWDLYAKVAGKPLWKLLVDMSPEQLVSCIPFNYITDALTPE